MLEIEKAFDLKFENVLSKFWDKETLFWKNLSQKNIYPKTGHRNGGSLRGVVHDDNAEIKDWFYPMLAMRLRAGDATANAEFIRRLDTPGRVIIELQPQQWITYDGPLLESKLRDIAYNDRLAKRSRNVTEPPDGWEMEFL